MDRKQLVATATVVVIGLGGLAFAAGEGSPLLQLVAAVKRVDANTVAIKDQTGAIAKETATVAQQNAAIVNETAAIAKANAQLDHKLDAVLSAIGKIEVPPPAPPAASPSPASAVWLAPYVYDTATATRSAAAVANVLNAGAAPATYTCSYFSKDGTRLVAHDSTMTIQPGSLGICAPRQLSQHVSTGWLLIVSDNPVIATGRNSRAEAGTTTTSENMPFRPIDCSGDVTGIEHVCDAVDAIQQGK